MLNSFDSMPPRDRIVVALDCTADEALYLAELLRGGPTWLKVGMTLFYTCGPAIVDELKKRGFKVFLDLKFHDIPHQAEGAAYAATKSGADMLSMHASGGIDMMRAVCAGCARANDEGRSNIPTILGITVLTSLNEDSLAQVGVSRSVHEQVMALAKQAQRAGACGVVASAKEAACLREALGADAYIVVPGIRPANYLSKDDQSRVATPAQAFECGASHIVIGRPITKDPNPSAAFDAIVAGLS